MQVDNLILEKCLGKGSFGEVYLSIKKGDDKNVYATKKYDREKIENSEAMKYLKNEISILQILNHPNIAKFEDIKKTKKHFYIVMEYCNGGELSKTLQKYLLKYGKPFPQEIVQYLMRQIIDAFKYIHGNKIIHRDIKLDNILLNYSNEQDKKDLNIMKAQVKIIDFGFSCIISKDSLTYTAIGNPINMDPLILKKLNSKGNKARQLGYDQKADIWSLGTICYEMLIGRAAFDAQDMDDLINKIENGKYNVPTNLSKEVISFLNGMLQYDSSHRLTCEQLSTHPFLTKNIRDFHKINLRQVSNKIDKNTKEIVIDVKKNRSIWAIFNKEDENILNKIPGQLQTVPEVHENHHKHSRGNSFDNKYYKKEENPIRQASTFQMKVGNNINNIGGIHNPVFINNLRPINNNNFYSTYITPSIHGIPQNRIYQQIPMPQRQILTPRPYSQTISAVPTTESNFNFNRGIYIRK